MSQLTDNPVSEMTETVAPEAPVEISAEQAQETADDAFLAKLDAAEDEIGVMMADLEEDGGEGVEDPTTPAIEDTPSDQEEDREQPDPIDNDEMEKALSALRRDGLPAEVVEKMTNQEVLELGLKRSKVQADTDNAYRELQELKKGGEDTADSTEDSASAEPVEQPSLVPDEAVKPFVDLFGEDGASALKGYTDAVVAPLMEQINGMVNVIGQYTANEARRQLGEQYPQLSDDQAYAKVEERMGSLLKSGSYSNAHELMADAARLTFADDQRDAAKAYRNKTRQMRANGQPLSDSKQAAPASLSHEEQEDMMLDMLEQGNSPAEARRAVFG